MHILRWIASCHQQDSPAPGSDVRWRETFTPKATGDVRLLDRTGLPTTAVLCDQSDLAKTKKKAEFPEPETQRRIPIGPPWGATRPDFFYADPAERLEGICI